MGEKNKEMQELKEKYLELEKKYNETMEDLPNYIQGQAMRLTMKHISYKDQEVQRLQEQLNQLLDQQGVQKTEMEIEGPRTRPERIEKEKVIPRQGMQTRSQGPPSFGEQIQQEVYDPLGNLISKRTGYTIPNMGEYGAYDIVVNLLQKAPGNNKIFKINFDNYAREVEGGKRTFDRDFRIYIKINMHST